MGPARPCRHPAGSQGRTTVLAPIEIGPALFIKTLHRSSRARRWPLIPPEQLIAASLFGLPPNRASDIKTSYQGFDFRCTIRFLEHHFGPVRMAGYSPFSIGGWYGNSQVFFWLSRR